MSNTPTPQDKSRVLVVEDNSISQEVAAAILRKLGCTVEVASNGKEAVTLAKENSYDLIFMDCQMPGMNGWEAASEIRRAEAGRGKRAKIVALTGYSLDQNLDSCMRAGMDDYLCKPIGLSDFQKILQGLNSPDPRASEIQ